MNESYDENDREGEVVHRFCQSCLKTGYHAQACPDSADDESEDDEQGEDDE